MRRIRIVTQFNAEDDADDASLREAIRIMMEDINEAIDGSDVLEFEGWASPIIESVHAEEEVVSIDYERWDL